MDVKSALIVSLALFAVLFVPPLAADFTNSNSMPTMQAIAAGPTAKLRVTYKVGDNFVLVKNQEYKGLAEYLRNEWGYY